MVRNIFLFIPIIFFGCLNPKTESTENKQEKPNVLFISVDDLRPELGCYGATYVKSPNLDKLASSGILFANHFVQVPTCGASRLSMLTGMLPKTPAHLGNEAIREFISGKSETSMPETFIHHLKRNGYYTVGIGKISHYADGLLYGYTDSVSTERELPHSWNELLFNPGKWGTGWNAFFGYANGENRQSMDRQVKPYEVADVDDMGYPDGISANIAIQKLKELSKKGKPFFLGVGFFKPHLPFNAPKKYWDLYDENKIPLAPFPGIPENINNSSLHNSGEFNGYLLGEEKASISHSISDDYARKVKHAYFACVSYIDAQIGKLLDELENSGLDKNTIVVVWGDHGWHLGDQRMWGKHTIFEKALKSTFIIRLPNNPQIGGSIDRVVSSVDIYPTMLELCGVEMPYTTDGKSLVPIIKDPNTNNWDDASYGYFKKGFSVRTDRYRLTQYFREQKPNIELYDHLIDPDETKNIS
ncbi:MAG: sulfatase, partial [Bacteroidales bacterium]|nr:sulfatase [Bacteroidales bacterium]